MDSMGNQGAGISKPAFGKAHGDDENVVCDSTSNKASAMQKMVEGVYATIQDAGTNLKKVIDERNKTIDG
jgi:hypothetical protein